MKIHLTIIQYWIFSSETIISLQKIFDILLYFKSKNNSRYFEMNLEF